VTAMPDYYLYLFGSDGHITARIELASQTDQSAIAAARERHDMSVNKNGFEVWDGPRQVHVEKKARP
jgi:hypothetical protein